MISTPDRRRKTRVCHINILKRFVCNSKPVSPPNPRTALPVTMAVDMSDVEETMQASVQWLQNSAVLEDLSSFLAHLKPKQSKQVVKLMHHYPSLFSDDPGRT